MIVSLMAAMSENRVIGVDNKLPWHLPEDLKRFKEITSGHPVIMGRKTFDSVGRPLPKRKNYVVTRNRALQIAGVVVVGSVEEVLRDYKNTEEEVFILGGGDIFTQTIASADRIYLTVIHKNFDGDSFFPEVPQGIFKVVSEVRHDGALPFTFRDFARR